MVPTPVTVEGAGDAAVIEAPRPGELPVGRVLPADAQDVSHQRAHRRPLLLVRHALSSERESAGRCVRECARWATAWGGCERRTHPGMLVDYIEQAQRDSANRRLRRRDDGLVHRACDDGAAGGQQVALVGNVPVKSTGPGGEPFGQRAEGQAVLSTAVQELDRCFNDAAARHRQTVDASHIASSPTL